MMLGVVVLGVVVLAVIVLHRVASEASGQASSDWVGQRVISHYGTFLKVGKQVVDDEGLGQDLAIYGHDRRRFRAYRVERVSGPWLCLVAEEGAARGWTNVEQVIPYDQAIDYFTNQIRAQPSAVLYIRRGLMWREKGEYDIAIADYSEAIRLDPRSAIAYVIRGISWFCKKEYDKAIDDCNEAIRLNPKDAWAYASRGLVRSGKEEYDRAIADYNEAIRLDPSNALAYLNRGNAWRDKKEYDKALTDYNEAIRLGPKHADAYNDRSLAWSGKEEYDKAIDDSSEAIRLDPKNVVAYNNRGHAWFCKKEYNRSIDDSSEAIRLDPKNVVAYNNRGGARGNKKEYDEALADFNEAIRLDPKNVVAYNNRAWLLATCPDERYRDGKWAVESATRSCELTDWKDAGALATLAAAYAESGDFDAAVRFQEKTLVLYADEKDRNEGRERLALYQAKKPYREEPKAR